MNDSFDPQYVREQVAMYLCGALTPDETRAVEAAIERGDETYVEAMSCLESGIVGLCRHLDPVTPDLSVRESVLDRVANDLNARAAVDPATTSNEPGSAADTSSQVWRDWDSNEEAHSLFTLQANEGGWEETGVEGIQVRRLFIDRSRNRMTAMFKMAPGTSYPCHVHDDAEECYVLEGDLKVGDRVLHAGDYQRAAPDSLHGVQSTEGGCTLLIVSSISDEIL